MILNAINKWAREKPEAVAIIVNDAPVTYAEFAQAIYATRDVLSARQFDLQKRGTVAIMSSGFPMWCIQLALRSMGLDTVFVHNLTSAAALRFRDLAAVVTTQRDVALRGKSSSIPFSCKLITLRDEFWRASIASQPVEWDNNVRIFGNHILYTSGTTGQYKKVLVDWRVERDLAERFCRLGYLQSDTISHVLGFGAHTSFGYREPITAWFLGATIIIDERPDALENLLRHAPTKITFTPDKALKFSKIGVLAHHLPSPPVVFLGSGFISYKVVKKFYDAGFNEFRIGYGSTECSRLLYSLVDSEEALVWLQPYPDRDVEIVDEHGKVCGNGEEGRLRIKLLHVDASGYFDDIEATASAFADGWFYPGDLAIMREDGRIRIVGRAGDVINLMGSKKATAPYEQAVQKITDASAVCIFQEVHLDGTDELVIALEAEQLPSPEMIERVRAIFPDQLDLRIEVLPHFPRTTAGTSKVQRQKLRKNIFG